MLVREPACFGVRLINKLSVIDQSRLRDWVCFLFLFSNPCMCMLGAFLNNSTHRIRAFFLQKQKSSV